MGLTSLLFPILREVALTQNVLHENQLNGNMCIESNGKFRDRHKGKNNCSHGSGARVVRHPFSKNLDDTTEIVFNRWMSGVEGEAIGQQWVDYSIHVPESFSILFEAKLSFVGSQNIAQKELVQGLFEASHYLGLPDSIDDNGVLRWKKFDYASLVICDATRGNFFATAYEALPKNVRDSFWSSAGIYPIILPIKTD